MLCGRRNKIKQLLDNWFVRDFATPRERGNF